MKSLLIVFLVTFFLSCNKKIIHPNDFKGNKIIFGNGGGFTGAVSSVILLENGDLFRVGSNDTNHVFIGKLNRNVTKNQFATYEMMNIDKLELNEPGNRYFFITKKTSDSEHKIIWGKNKLENNLPKLYYENMMLLVEELEAKEKNTKE